MQSLNDFAAYFMRDQLIIVCNIPLKPYLLCGKVDSLITLPSPKSLILLKLKTRSVLSHHHHHVSVLCWLL